jgi:hypothetical protein
MKLCCIVEGLMLLCCMFRSLMLLCCVRYCKLGSRCQDYQKREREREKEREREREITPLRCKMISCRLGESFIKQASKWKS